MQLEKSATDLVIHEKTQVATMSYSNMVSFWNPHEMTMIKEFPTKTQVNSAHLHPNSEHFVFGGADFKIYKCDLGVRNIDEIYMKRHNSVRSTVLIL